MITMETHAGQHISDAIDCAITLAQQHAKPVEFIFNDLPVVVAPDDNEQAVLVRWTADMNARSEAWRKSPAGRKSAREAARRQAKAQRDAGHLLKTIPWAASHMDRIVPWCARFAEAADHIGVKGIDYARILSVLRRAGYVSGAMVGNDPDFIRSRRIYQALYIVGQAMSCMERGMPPHPIIGKFAADYAATPKGGPVMRSQETEA